MLLPLPDPATPAFGRHARPARQRFEMVVTADPEIVARIVRVASTGPFSVHDLWLGSVRTGRRRMRMTVAGSGEVGFETLRKRLDRLVGTLKVRTVE